MAPDVCRCELGRSDFHRFDSGLRVGAFTGHRAAAGKARVRSDPDAALGLCDLSAALSAVAGRAGSVGQGLIGRTQSVLTHFSFLRVGMQFVTLCVTQGFCDVRWMGGRLRSPFRPSASYFDEAKVTKTFRSGFRPDFVGFLRPVTDPGVA
ncbi:hypothetical protein ALQ98_101292, partial [Pseudomonas syringae pv. lapsa]